MGFIQTPLNIYMVSILNTEPPMQNTIAVLQSLPWSLKLVFGFISDIVPINGLHRKPYLTLGALIYSTSYITYAFSDINDAAVLALCIFIGTLGMIMMDVMSDTMVLIILHNYYSIHIFDMLIYCSVWRDRGLKVMG
jgi:hypothetical protein